MNNCAKQCNKIVRVISREFSLVKNAKFLHTTALVQSLNTLRKHRNDKEVVKVAGSVFNVETISFGVTADLFFCSSFATFMVVFFADSVENKWKHTPLAACYADASLHANRLGHWKVMPTLFFRNDPIYFHLNTSNKCFSVRFWCSLRDFFCALYFCALYVWLSAVPVSK